MSLQYSFFFKSSVILTSSFCLSHRYPTDVPERTKILSLLLRHFQKKYEMRVSPHLDDVTNLSFFVFFFTFLSEINVQNLELLRLPI